MRSPDLVLAGSSLAQSSRRARPEHLVEAGCGGWSFLDLQPQGFLIFETLEMTSLSHSARGLVPSLP